MAKSASEWNQMFKLRFEIRFIQSRVPINLTYRCWLADYSGDTNVETTQIIPNLKFSKKTRYLKEWFDLLKSWLKWNKSLMKLGQIRAQITK